jgi:hypothetical protein
MQIRHIGRYIFQLSDFVIQRELNIIPDINTAIVFKNLIIFFISLLI